MHGNGEYGNTPGDGDSAIDGWDRDNVMACGWDGKKMYYRVIFPQISGCLATVDFSNNSAI